jgi:hypothetical protein
MSQSTALLLAALVAATPLAAQAAHRSRPAAPEATASPAADNLPPASAKQMADAERALYGRYACDLRQSVELDRDPNHPGYIHLSYKHKVWVMRPVLSVTGALRVEDVTGQLLFLQTAYKSMLLDMKTGHPLEDACVHPAQRAAEAAGTGRTAHLFD